MAKKTLKPSEWITKRATKIAKKDGYDFTSISKVEQAILDYLDAHQCKGGCRGENCECLECDIKYDR